MSRPGSARLAMTISFMSPQADGTIQLVMLVQRQSLMPYRPHIQSDQIHNSFRLAQALGPNWPNASFLWTPIRENPLAFFGSVLSVESPAQWKWFIAGGEDMKSLVFTIGLAAVLGMPAFSQEATGKPKDGTERTREGAQAAVPNKPLSKATMFVGSTVKSADGRPVGKVQDLVLDLEKGEVGYAVVAL